MNYIWELAIKAVEQNLDPDEIEFKFGKPFSPYMELSFVHMNEKDVIYEVEINPYYRYYKIFKDILEPNLIENPEFKEVILDLFIHHLKDIDVLMGMNKREYYINFVIRDMKNGYYGKFVEERMDYFNYKEQKTIANNILNHYSMGESIFLLKDTVGRIFTKAYIFSNQFEKDEVVFFLRTKETKEKFEQIELIKYLFLPFNYNVEVFWDKIFGVLGIDEFMNLSGILNY